VAGGGHHGAFQFSAAPVIGENGVSHAPPARAETLGQSGRQEAIVAEVAESAGVIEGGESQAGVDLVHHDENVQFEANGAGK